MVAGHDAAAEARVVRRLDWNLMPLVFVVRKSFLLASLDRSNIGNALTAGMDRDLHLSSSDYQWLLTIFYIAYIIFEVTVLLYKVFPPRYIMSFMTLLWGLSATLQSVAQNWSGMMALRFLLGTAETTVGPGIVYFLSFFYHRRELGFRCGLFFSSAALASTFAGALAYGITSGKQQTLAPWRLLFLVEGLPTLALVPIIFFFLPDSAHTARFLDANQKEIAAVRNVRQAGAEKRYGGFELKSVIHTLSDIKAWLSALMYFSMNTSYSSLPVYLPTLLKELGFSSINAQGLTAPPYLLAFFVCLASTWSADKSQQRALHIIVLSCIGATGYVLLAATESVAARYAGVYLAAAGIFPAIANVLPWVMNNQGSDEGRGIGIFLLNVVGQCGPLLGTRLYPANEGPHYTKGHAVCAGFLFFNALLALTLRIMYWRENRILDRKYGTLPEIAERNKTQGDADAVQMGVENFGESFRYIL